MLLQLMLVKIIRVAEDGIALGARVMFFLVMYLERFLGMEV